MDFVALCLPNVIKYNNSSPVKKKTIDPINLKNILIRLPIIDFIHQIQNESSILIELCKVHSTGKRVYCILETEFIASAMCVSLRRAPT